MDVIDRVPALGRSATDVREAMVAKRAEARAYTRVVGDDLPEVRDWTWPSTS
jgi:xylulose-5-phosphate/fructose-6-phosphate phosphoketolase